jgi:hypothetical protein
MNLKLVLAEFVKTFQRQETNFGIIDIYPRPFSVNEPFPIGSALIEYFSTLQLKDRVMIGGQFHLGLYALSELERQQDGWLWDRDRLGNVVEDTKYWKRTWVVIGDRSDDALFVDINDGKVFGSIQKRNFFIANTLADFFMVLTEGIKIEIDKFFYETCDEDFNPKPEFLLDVEDVAKDKLGVEGAQAFMKYFFG